MRVIQNLCPPERYYLKCPFSRVPDRVVVHNTGNDASARNEVSYMLRRPEEVSFHYAVDDREAVQGLPLGRNAWASGDGQGAGNLLGIHIEICYSRSGGERFLEAERNAARLIASLLERYRWPLERVTKHQDYDGKYCPHRTLDMGWERFIKMAEEEMTVSYEQFVEYMERYRRERAEKPVSPWAKGAWEEAQARGLMDGSGPRSPLTREQAAVILGHFGKGDREQGA